MQKFVQWCLVRIFCNECSRSTPLALNSCFGAFLSVWVHLEPFRYCTKLAAKHAKLVQLMQKFRPRRLVRIFCNERSRSTLLDPKLMFWCVSFHLGVFWTVSLLYETCCKSSKLVQLMQMFMHDVVLEFFATNTPDPHHWTLNSSFGAFHSIWVHLEPFRNCTKLAAKRAKLVQLMQKFMPRYRARIFHNKRSQSTPLDPKLMFWCVSFRLGAFGTVSLLNENAPN